MHATLANTVGYRHAILNQFTNIYVKTSAATFSYITTKANMATHGKS